MLSARSAIERLKTQLQQLDKSLSTSFSNLRSDLESHSRAIDSLKARITEHERIISQMQREATIRDQHESQVYGKRSAIRQPQSNLAPLHLDILKRLMILQMESGKRTVSMRELAEELYPQKPYTSIKTTLSRYIKRLGQRGLIGKMQKGRLYLSYTEKALEFADRAWLNRMEELISQPMER